jgi:hypothetical protein
LDLRRVEHRERVAVVHRHHAARDDLGGRGRRSEDGGP